MLNAQMS